MEIAKDDKTALVFGASGLIGGFVVNFLLLHPAYSKVVVFVRRPLQMEHPKLVQHLVNFDQPETFRHLVKGDDLFSCMGTTMAIAGSKEAFYKVDFTYPFEAAQMASQNGVGQYLLVSSVGADPKSRFFYSQVKGEMEEAVKKLGFWGLHIFQPSVLLGERNENRFGEQLAGKIGSIFDRLTGGLLTKYRPIEADVVAKAMVSAAQGLKPGVHVYPSHWLQGLAAQIDQAMQLKN
ncbi:MAG: oxidoreductase [Saprospiraceae bacterium]|nr:oxidoreductase [Saprospiraceae bacterium]